MTVRLFKESLPPVIRKKAWEGRKEKVSFLLPTGAKVWFEEGKGFFGYGYAYDNSDIAPYLLNPNSREAI